MKLTGKGLTKERVEQILDNEKRVALIKQEGTFETDRLTEICQMLNISDSMIILARVYQSGDSVEIAYVVPYESNFIPDNISALHKIFNLFDDNNASEEFICSTLGLNRIEEAVVDRLIEYSFLDKIKSRILRGISGLIIGLLALPGILELLKNITGYKLPEMASQLYNHSPPLAKAGFVDSLPSLYVLIFFTAIAIVFSSIFFFTNRTVSQKDEDEWLLLDLQLAIDDCFHNKAWRRFPEKDHDRLENTRDKIMSLIDEKKIKFSDSIQELIDIDEEGHAVININFVQILKRNQMRLQ